jgi:hypothetical protein
MTENNETEQKQEEKILDYNNPEEVEKLILQKDQVIAQKEREKEKNYNMWIKANMELTSVKQQLNDVTAEKNKWHKEAIRANKSIFDQKVTQEEGSKGSLLDDMLKTIDKLAPESRRKYR